MALPVSFEGAWEPSAGLSAYQHQSIDSLKITNSRICITGRIANLEHYPSNSKDSKNAKFRLSLIVRDETAAVEVRLWYSTAIPLESGILGIGRLVKVYSNSVGPKEGKTIGMGIGRFVKALLINMNEWDKHARIVIMNDDLEGNASTCRAPVGASSTGTLNGLIPLTMLKDDGRALVCVKSVGAVKLVKQKDGRSTFKALVGIFDDTSDTGITIILWGVTAHSVINWKPSETTLLLTDLCYRTYLGKKQFGLGKTSLIDVDPDLKDAKWLREYAQKKLWAGSIGLRFPEGVFDFTSRFSNKYVTLNRLANIIEEDPNKVLAGKLSVIIGKWNITHLFKKNMLFACTCCGIQCYTNECVQTCKSCERQLPLVLNPQIIDFISDESGSIPGSHLIVSDRFWRRIFKIEPAKLPTLGLDALSRCEEYMFYMRMTVKFGFSREFSKLCLWDVQGI